MFCWWPESKVKFIARAIEGATKSHFTSGTNRVFSNKVASGCYFIQICFYYLLVTLSLSSAAQPPVITASAEWVLSSSHSAYRCRDQLDPPFSFHSLLRSLFSFPAAVMPSDLREAVFDLACSLLPVRLTPSSPVSPPRRIPSPSRLALWHRALAASILVGVGGSCRASSRGW